MDEQRVSGGRDPHVWAPPDAGASRDAAVGRGAPAWPGGTGVPDGEADGPPPPPWERDRRRRRRGFVGAAVAVILALGIGLAVAGTFGSGDPPPVATEEPPPEDGPGDGDGAPDGTPPGPQPLEPPDLDRLDGADAAFAQLLLDVDESEQVMIGFQQQLREIFAGSTFDEAEELFEAVSAAGGDSADRLEAARGPLEQPVADVRAEAVREVYLEHLDSWVRYMRAVEADPLLLGPEQDEARFTLSINATADAFARSLEDQLPDDADPEVQRMVDELLDRGFRPQGQSDV